MAKVLICEDDKDVLKVLKRTLESGGYETFGTQDEERALETLRQPHCFDLLLTDIVLSSPKSGLELATQARILNPDLPIILMTGYSSDDIKLGKSRLDDFPLLSKPMTCAELLYALSIALNSAPNNEVAH